MFEPTHVVDLRGDDFGPDMTLTFYEDGRHVFIYRFDHAIVYHFGYDCIDQYTEFRVQWKENQHEHRPPQVITICTD